MCVFLVWCHLGNVMHRGRAGPEKETSNAARCGKAAIQPRKRFQWKLGVRKEGVYISRISLKSSSATIYFQAVQVKRPSFLGFFNVDSAPAFSFHVIRVSVFLSVYSSLPVSIIAWNKGAFVLSFFSWSCRRCRSGVLYCTRACV